MEENKIEILSSFTDEDLKEELKRRNLEKQKERLKIKRCRHCKYAYSLQWYNIWRCNKVKIGKKYPRDKVINLSMKACNCFENKE